MLVGTDTGERIRIVATAKPGVVAPDQLGAPVIVRARIATRSDATRPPTITLEILRVRKHLLLTEAAASRIARDAAIGADVDLTAYPHTQVHYSGSYGVWRVVFRGERPGQHVLIDVDDVTRAAKVRKGGR